MLAMEYCLPMGHPQNQQSQIKYASSTMSSETISESCGSRNNRIRTVRLVRPVNGTLPPPNLTCKHGPNLGFSLRGGREHGTGFFVSNVEPGSEAHRQGLRVGDQIVRINGFTIEDAVHKEVLQLISNHTHLTLKVRSVGMIPIKDKKTDSLSWQIITNDTSSLRSSPQLHEKIHDVRISIMVAPRSKLGCGICKGPEWKPGIFIQFTKDGGIAREAGLRPGDQILICNNVDFSDIPFNEAVNLMKTSRQLDLVVRKSAGSELFPGESSGYNSSASSVTGDQSPSWSDSKRLSIVKEESLDLEDRLSQLDQRFKKMSNSTKWDAIEWDEIHQEEKPLFKPTIINLSENGTTIKNNGSEEEFYESTRDMKTFTEQPHQPQPPEMKTVVVEVHRSDEEKSKVENNQHNILMKSASVSSFGSIASRSSTASSSLSSAICQEIQRRSQKKATSTESEEKPSIDEQLQMKKILKGVSQDKQFQHTKLMDEFKKAHQKMFRTASDSEMLQNRNGIISKETSDRLANKEAAIKASEKVLSATLNKPKNGVEPAKVPPPPPPMPTDDEPDCPVKNHNLIDTPVPPPCPKAKPKGKAPPVPVKYSTLSYTNNTTPQPKPLDSAVYKNITYQNNEKNNIYSTPEYYCPTPDYDTLSIASSTTSTSTFRPGHVNDSVEMESLESFRLDGTNEVPKPPNTYFKKNLCGTLSNGSSANSINGTLRKQRPVSVTIGEYPTMRRQQPGKLDFLGVNGVKENSKQPVSTQFSNELAETLKRSNLRKRTESVENLLLQNKEEISPQTNGSVRISLSNNLNKNLAKSTNDLSNNNVYEKTLLAKNPNNRVTININNLLASQNENRKTDSPNGILKNSVNGGQNIANAQHKPLSQQKSITFGRL
ncbi:harmonin isoform X2 [Aethina tumida]|uniref:harmonin isoform X2 n=1 Tax=Aethina tumida TaxID=116153 RepID=UPI0021479668|nr:harmonin isoform X2 [Aethina tumida]